MRHTEFSSLSTPSFVENPISDRKGRLRQLSLTAHSSGRTPLSRGSDGRFGLRRFRAKLTPTPFGTRRALTHALPPSLRPPFCPFASVALFFLAAALVKEKTPTPAEGKKHEIR